MKALNSLGILPSIALFAILFMLPIITQAQCKTDLTVGQNIVTNGDFSQNYAGWNFTPDTDGDIENTGPDGYQIFTGSPRSYSIPGNIYVGTGADMYGFNNAFSQPFFGHTTGAASDKFLMVDGVCVVGIKLWRQSNIPVIPNTRYYFTVWINSLKDNANYPGILNFDVNGVNLATGIVAPLIGGASVGGAWKKVEAFWDSGTTPPATVTISIEGNQLIGCGGNDGESDFAIDDISFVPGCGYSDNGPIPNLGVDRTICGLGGSLTIDSNVPHTDSTLVTWSANAPGANSGFGMSAPYSKIITTPGTYSVCVTAGNACTRSDIIVISNTFTPNTTPDANLCGIPTAPLDAVFTGIGVTYQWKRNGVNLPAPSTNRTYNATTVGTYTVDVSVVGCGTVTSGNTIISSSATAAPTTSPNANLCSTNPVPLDAVLTGTGITYQWKLNGVNLAAPSTNKTYSAISPGNYTVDVKLPGCTTTTSGTTVVTSSSPVTPIDAFYCANVGDGIALSRTLGASGTNSGTFKWYTASNGITPFNTGASYNISIPDGTTGTQTFYVQDETISNGTVGATSSFSSGSFGDVDAGNAQGSGFGINFTANQTFDITSVQIPIRIDQTDGTTPMTITSVVLKVYKQDGTPTTITATSNNASVVIPAGNSATFALYTFTFSNFTITPSLPGVGSALTLKIDQINSNYPVWRFKIGKRTGVSPSPYPFASSISNVTNITSSYEYGAAKTDTYYGLYNWGISAQTPCSRIPVRLINNCPTPVTWTSFYLIPQEGSCKLVWSTADETNNAYFTVERSLDGINFETIATISGAGNRDIASNYYYVDNAPVSGTSYYRITQHDFDGKFSSTAMKPYLSNGLIEITTYPNPFQNNTTLLVSGADTESYTYTLYSISGQFVEQGSGTVNQTQTVGEAVSKGMYMLTVVTSTDIVTTKIVKQ